ncbi:MAG: RNA polymerase sigma factor, partial [Planctomycetota bacterium]
MGGSFDDVYARYGRQVHAYLARLTGDACTAEDLCQETFLRYLKKERKLVEANGNLRGWLFLTPDTRGPRDGLYLGAEDAFGALLAADGALLGFRLATPEKKWAAGVYVLTGGGKRA